MIHKLILACTNGSKIPFTTKGRIFYEINSLELLIGSQPIIEGRTLICGGRINIA